MGFSCMDENNARGISIVAYPVASAFKVPITNLVNICSAVDQTHLFLGTTCKIDFQQSNKLVQLCNFSHHSSSSKIKQCFRYGLLQLKIIQKLILSRKNIRGVIFFMETPPFLPMVIAKICNMKAYWLLPSMYLPLSNDFSIKMLTLPSRTCFNMCNRIILYSSRLVSYWGLEEYRYKILIAHRHFLDFNIFTVTTHFVDRPFLIGYMGRFSKEKGVQNFIQAIPDILTNRQEMRVLIGGNGELRDEIEASIHKGCFSTRVDFPGWISHEDLPKYLNKLRLLVLPSYTEGLPNIMLEAMACGTPVLATPVGAIPDVIVDGKTGFIMDNNSPECIKKNIVRALDSPELEQIGENGRKFAEENFTFERVVAKWKDIVENI
jgi:glycosyltransferase involved in cell wall biosynthesis